MLGITSSPANTQVPAEAQGLADTMRVSSPYCWGINPQETHQHIILLPYPDIENAASHAWRIDSTAMDLGMQHFTHASSIGPPQSLHGSMPEVTATAVKTSSKFQ